MRSVAEDNVEQHAPDALVAGRLLEHRHADVEVDHRVRPAAGVLLLAQVEDAMAALAVAAPGDVARDRPDRSLEDRQGLVGERAAGEQAEHRAPGGVRAALLDGALERPELGRRRAGRRQRRRLERVVDLVRRVALAQADERRDRALAGRQRVAERAHDIPRRRLRDEQDRLRRVVRAEQRERLAEREPADLLREVAPADAAPPGRGGGGAGGTGRPPPPPERPRPPTPTICDTPPPAAATRHATSCAPVPAAATIPTGPDGTALQNPSPTPPSIAVPQPGPMTSSPWSRPRRLSAISSATETWSENRKTCRPRLNARCASSAAYSPGTDTSATFAPASSAAAAPSERGGAAAAPAPPSAPPPALESIRSASASAASTSAASPPSTAITTSPGDACASAPRSASAARFAGVPIATSHAAIPSRARRARAIPMSRTLSA